MRPIRDLAGDEKGNFLVFFALSLVALFGMVALAFDVGRMGDTHTDLQSFADTVALAAAAELDGKATSIDSAILAAQTLVTDTQIFASGDRTLNSSDVTLTFLDALPANDSNADAADDVVCTGAACSTATAAQQRSAIFVRVDVAPHTVTLDFASVVSGLLGGSRQDARIGATATAGNDQLACDISPLMFCLPLNAANQPVDLTAGQMVRLRAGGGNQGFWGPGNFGFLDISSAAVDGGGPCAGLNGANVTRCLLGAIDKITQCYSLRGVDTDTGQRVGITTDPFNFRFDMFDNNANSERQNANFAPAPNTIRGADPTSKGKSGNLDWCTTTPATTSMRLPRGAEFADDTRRFGSTGTFAVGSADRDTYMATNHNWVAGNPDPFPTATTRWQVYKAEIAALANNRLMPATTAASTARLETGRPMCAAAPVNDPYRRIIVAAGVNCAEEQIQGNTTGVAVTDFYEFFLTEPVITTGGEFDIFGEVVGKAGSTGGGSGVFREVVQLYR